MLKTLKGLFFFCFFSVGIALGQANPRDDFLMPDGDFEINCQTEVRLVIGGIDRSVTEYTHEEVRRQTSPLTRKKLVATSGSRTNAMGELSFSSSSSEIEIVFLPDQEITYRTRFSQKAEARSWIASWLGEGAFEKITRYRRIERSPNHGRYELLQFSVDGQDLGYRGIYTVIDLTPRKRRTNMSFSSIVTPRSPGERTSVQETCEISRLVNQ